MTAGYAFTDYKSQGQTIEYVIIDIGRPPTGFLEPSFRGVEEGYHIWKEYRNLTTKPKQNGRPAGDRDLNLIVGWTNKNT